MSNSVVAQNAVTPDALPLSRTALMGVILKPEGDIALLRTAQGEIVKIAVGAFVGRREVAAIDDDGLILVNEGRAERMAILPR